MSKTQCLFTFTREIFYLNQPSNVENICFVKKIANNQFYSMYLGFLHQRYLMDRVCYRHLDPQAVFHFFLFVRTQVTSVGLS